MTCVCERGVATKDSLDVQENPLIILRVLASIAISSAPRFDHNSDISEQRNVQGMPTRAQHGLLVANRGYTIFGLIRAKPLEEQLFIKATARERRIRKVVLGG